MSGPPFTVKALFDYTSEHEDDLNFQIGNVITVTAEEDADWYYGEYVDDSGKRKEGIFPRNFVERYEPTAPPRPTRPTRAKKEPEPAPPPPEPVAESPALEGDKDNQTEEYKPEPVVGKELPPPPSAPTAVSVAAEAVAPPPKQPEPQQTSAAKAPVPPASSKPSSNSFRDRIAAFNKPAAAPITPFKPGGLGGSNTFIKKPFVPPPPSKDAYVPPPREAPSKTYRREEDSEAVSREPPISEVSQPLPAPEPSQDEDEPKPTSLKERIALLQKQQLEQAARLADAAQKKEKPKKPPTRKRTDPEDVAAPITASEGADLERTESLQTPRDEHPAADSEAVEESSRPQLASPPQPSRELVSDTNDADYSGAGDTEDAEETSTSREDIEERPRSKHAAVADQEGEDDNEENGEDSDENHEEEEVDPEVKRRMELRERMAKMSGGMGMMGMFGGGMPGMYAQAGSKKAKAPQDAGRDSIDEPERAAPPSKAPPVPLMALPGMNVGKQEPQEVGKEEESGQTPVSQLHSPDEVPDIEDVTEERELPLRKSIDRAPPPPPPQERAVPPLPPTETRPPPPPIPGTQPAPPPAPESRPVPIPTQSVASLSPGSESDDELSIHTKNMSLDEVVSGGTAPEAPPPPPRRASTFGSPRSPTVSEKRFSRGPPPIPTNPPQSASPPQARPPPPPPPGVLSRQSTADTKRSIVNSPTAVVNDDIEDETTEYEADYDTDIAPGAKYKDALKAHDRHSSFDDGGEESSLQSPRDPPDNRPPPPLPPTAPHAVPPPPPSQPPKRASIDAPRSAPPPPPPPAKNLVAEEEEEEENHRGDDDEYDPYRYNAPRPALPAQPPSLPPLQVSPGDLHDDDDLYDASPTLPQGPPPPRPERAAAPPPPPPTTDPVAAPRGRQSLDISRSLTTARRSMDVPRPSVDVGFIAADVDLAESSFWWTQPSIPPPVFQNRKDLIYEVEESTSAKRGGKATVNKDVYVIFADYSQTIINVRFDPKNPSDVSLEQHHEPPPNKLRQDQLESAHERYGSRISAAIGSIQNTTVGDGTPYGLIQHLLAPLPDVLAPIGARSYGALVYSNLANASIQQSDEIRAGDIVSFRNARFQGHRGGLHQKYSAEVGKPDHVGVVVDWDGTKKKIHAWEQGRESKKVKTESFKLGDLKSGEVKVWRVMPRSWVGWDSKQ
ncbi:hypothetical protein BGW36DRAFT_431750 [Talaromyces proteolyticus]|uniref:SH3 domain-containing protein n=1 Tax=Talaromyces proteolyticus TaxID=1131652 RepID=A0AAD4PSF8_9EURO|nr:uncharacterized protein BGW36DRAFT_431750 [Talaromyces proteolyticus]KAH8691191.1 hypothetical protein BGW36DRAFT_431750 [Talaromyces proteolyticus]